ncbi:hypothetical protein M8I34_26390 [Streptomyces sp. MCA2]|uniref:hypothetical protein n=1 Tax=Streptomyces sp. MCA2 TaxID=2944805 RepID=UPI002020205A|nr:hypothetical protein [Streptomyces sp. MCA2]MCL7494904.1 hypothetical protein [Streptomyces sp. MCA2]
MSRLPAPAPPPASWRRGTALGVPGLILLGAVLSVLSAAFSADTFHDCHYFGPSLRMHIFGWAGLCAGLAAPVLYAVLHRGALRRGWVPALSRASGPTLVLLVLGVLPLLFEAFVVWTLYAPDPAGGHDCSGLAYALVGRGPHPAG